MYIVCVSIDVGHLMYQVPFIFFHPESATEGTYGNYAVVVPKRRSKGEESGPETVGEEAG